MPATASRIVLPPSSSPRSQPSKPRWNNLRCLTRNGGNSRRRVLARGRARRARREIGIEKIGRRNRLDAARELHLLELGVELERHRRHAIDDLVEEDAQLAARAIDHRDRIRQFDRRQVPNARELPLDFVGERNDRVEPDHLDRARCLVHVRPRVLERRGRRGVGRVRGERLEPAAQRLADLTLDP